VSRYLYSVLLLILCSCGPSEEPGTQAIVGAALYNPPDPMVANSIVLVRDGVIVAIGPQQTVPIPAASAKVNGLGKTVMPAREGDHLVVGGPANLLLVIGDPAAPDHKVERRMTAGRWEGN
jgi:hypothetical protein